MSDPTPTSASSPHSPHTGARTRTPTGSRAMQRIFVGCTSVDLRPLPLLPLPLARLLSPILRNPASYPTSHAVCQTEVPAPCAPAWPMSRIYLYLL